MPARRAYFTPELFRFLRELARHNNREWFAANKERYDEHVKRPLLSFIADVGVPLAKISRQFVADPRPSGGSMFRIYRDTRFAKDKRPYKTNAAAHFRHAAGKDAHAPGFYLHLEPGECMAGAGLWRPDGASTAQIRRAIAGDPTGWKKAALSKRFREHVQMLGDRLVRPPRGFDAEHPLIEEIKRKDWVAMVSFTDAEVCSPAFLAAYIRAAKLFAPMVRFLTVAVGQPF